MIGCTDLVINFTLGESLNKFTNLNSTITANADGRMVAVKATAAPSTPLVHNR